MIPVDYTRRKHVRKRPHGGPGQVLYVQEHTFYVTPSEDRLERLGARRDRLGE
jgi:predicted ribosome quality control (RQC) complex YloA/Tae2 family protein